MMAKNKVTMLVFLLVTVGMAACKKAKGNFWQRVDGKAMTNNLLETQEKVTSIQCLLKCTAIDDCKSINYLDSITFCELNRKDSRDSNVTFESRDGWAYYEIFQQPAENPSPAQACVRLSPCKYGTCKDVPDAPGYNCTCDEGYTGSNCDIIAPGMKAETAAISCLVIRKQYGTKGPPSGMYWIMASQPVQMYCDMEVDGGGWTKVANMNITSNTMTYSALYYHDAVESLDMIESQYYALSTAGLANLRQLINFTSVRLYCYKPSTNRTFHIVTANKSVVDYMTNISVTRPPSCDSYVMLEDDSSVLARNCSQWSNGKWFYSDPRKAELLSYLPAYISYKHYINVGNFNYRFECDDYNPGSKIGVWMFFVR